VRPLAELEPATCRQLAGVVFDVDDTITSDGLLTDDAYGALWALARGGLTLVAVTGRPLGWCDVMAQLFPVALAVGENGGGWCWRPAGDRHIHEGYWDPAPERDRQRVLLDQLVARVAAELPQVALAGDQRHRRVDVAFDVGERAAQPAAVVDRLAALITGAGARAVVSSVHAHACLGSHDKASGVARAAAGVLGADLDGDRGRWLFVGDSGNDAPAFAHFPLSVGVANVRAHLARLPVPPAFVASGACGRGFAEVAAHLLAARAGVSSPGD
jgi:HAD superfamily hydrolase (TIGR01484 family)